MNIERNPVFLYGNHSDVTEVGSLQIMKQQAEDLDALTKRVRRRILDITYDTKSAHLGSCFSCVEILVALYYRVLKHSPQQISNALRDRFIMSKGHACLAYYVVLTERGFMPEDVLSAYGINGGTLEHHSKREPQWGIEVSSGSLGHGLALGAGMAKAAQLDEHDYRTFVLLSDGELNEGSVWEAVMFAAHHRLHNLIAIVDYNRIQALGNVDEVLEPFDLAEKWRAFGWNVKEVDGHDIAKLADALSTSGTTATQPTVVLANTTKGKGVSFMEHRLLWHYRCPDQTELIRAQQEISG